MYNWYGLNQIEDDSWLLYWIDRGQQKRYWWLHTSRQPNMLLTIALLLTSVYPAQQPVIILYLVYIGMYSESK